MLKRILALTLVATMLMTMACGMVFAAETITLKATIDKASVKANDIITLSIYIEGTESVSMATWELLYDSEAFEYVDGSVTSAMGKNTASVDTEASKVLMVSFSGGSTATAVQTAQFKAIKEVEDVTAFDFAFDDACSQVCNPDGDDYDIIHENATVNIAPSFNATYAVPAEATVEIGATEADVLAALPTTVVVKDSEAGTKTDSVAVAWTCDAFDSSKVGALTYTGTLDPDTAGAAIFGAELVATATVNVVKIAEGIEVSVAKNAFEMVADVVGDVTNEQSAEKVAEVVAAALENKVTLKKGAVTEEITLDASAFVASNAVTNPGDTATVTITVPAGVAAEKFELAEAKTIEVTVEVMAAVFDAASVDALDAVAVNVTTDVEDVVALLPATVTVRDASGANQEVVAVKNWTSADYDANEPGTYVFVADVCNGDRATVPADLKASINVIVNKLVAEDEDVKVAASKVGMLLKYNDSGVAVERTAEEIAEAVVAALGGKLTLQKGAYVEEIELTADMITVNGGIAAEGGATTVSVTLPAGYSSKYFDVNTAVELEVEVAAFEAVLRVVPSVEKVVDGEIVKEAITQVKAGDTFTLDVYVDAGVDSLYLDAASWTIPYDTSLFEYVDGSLYSAFGSNSTSVRGGNIYMMALGHRTINTNEPVQSLELKAVDSVDVNTSYEFNFDIIDSELSGENGIMYTIAHQSALVTIVPSFIATNIVPLDALDFEVNTTEDEVLAALPTQVTVTNAEGTKKDKVDLVNWKLIPEGTEFNSETTGTLIYEAELDASNAKEAVLGDALVGTKVQIEVNIRKIFEDITFGEDIDAGEAGNNGLGEFMDGGIVYIRPVYAFGDSWQSPAQVAAAVYEKLGGVIALSKGDYAEKLAIDAAWVVAADGVSGLGSQAAVTITIPAGTKGEYFEFLEDTVVTLTAVVKMLGDANIDGVINGKDAFTIQKFVLYGEDKVAPNWDWNEANVILDGKVNGRDAIAIQRYVLYGVLY